MLSLFLYLFAWFLMDLTIPHLSAYEISSVTDRLVERGLQTCTAQQKLYVAREAVCDFVLRRFKRSITTHGCGFSIALE